MYKIKEFAEKTGVSVRTLHYCDEIGLLKPAFINESGYRIYSIEDYATIQQILFFRELGFKLSEIKEIINNPNYNKVESLNKHLKLLTTKKERLNKVIDSVEEIISKIKRGESVIYKKEFEDYNKGIAELKEKYKFESEEKYGENKAYKESRKRTSKYTKDDWNTIMAEGNELYQRFTETMNDYKSDEAQYLVVEWKKYITKHFYNCTDEILKGLGELYVVDERFTKNIDNVKPGLAKFMSDAIRYYTTKKG